MKSKTKNLILVPLLHQEKKKEKTKKIAYPIAFPQTGKEGPSLSRTRLTKQQNTTASDDDLKPFESWGGCGGIKRTSSKKSRTTTKVKKYSSKRSWRASKCW